MPSIPDKGVITRDEYLFLRDAINAVLAKNSVVQTWGEEGVWQPDLDMLDSAVVDLETARNMLRGLDEHFKVQELP